jgi:threonylcarbamoyladenosine tRNA methylthiotransferase MtaB
MVGNLLNRAQEAGCMVLRVAIFTVGCRANQADSDEIVRALDPCAVEVVDGQGQLDLAVVNTCCVTARAERDCRKLARRALRSTPGARIALTGCAVTAIDGFGDDLGDGVETIGGGDVEPALVARWINEIAGPSAEGAARAGRIEGRTRALLKVQNGCSHGCAYCVVPAARGVELSTPLAEVVERVESLADDGYRELVLTGVQLGAWGCDLPGSLRLADLVLEVAERFAAGRVRLSSIEPWSVDDALLDVVTGHDHVCSHLHVPLQSGDDRVLAAMGRGYRTTDIADLVRRIRRRDPELALGTDLICGFPGEDDGAFARSIDLIRQIEPAYLHVFPFSPRPGTRACGMPEQASDRQIKDRVATAITAGREAQRRYRERQVGRGCQVVVETGDGAVARGVTETFIPVLIAAAGLRPGQLVNTRIERLDASGQVRAVVLGSQPTDADAVGVVAP